MTKKTGNSLQAILNRASAEPDIAPSTATGVGGVGETPAAVRRGRRKSGEVDQASPIKNPGRVGTKLIGGHFPPSISMQLKILAVEEETTVQALLEEAIADLLTKKAGRKVRR